MNELKQIKNNNDKLSKAFPMVGLTADWCCQAWEVHKHVVIFENETDSTDDNYSIVVHQWCDDSGESTNVNLITGSYEQVIEIVTNARDAYDWKLFTDDSNPAVTLCRMVADAQQGTLSVDNYT